MTEALEGQMSIYDVFPQDTWASEIEEFCIAVTKKHFPEEEEGKDGEE